MPQHRFWFLLAKKNSGEASASEIEELEEIMRLHPEWHYSAQHIQDIWGLNTKEDPLAAEEAFQLHLGKMKKAGFSLQVDEESGPDLILDTPARSNRSRLRTVLTASLVSGLVIAVFVFLLKPEGTKPSTESLKISEISTRPGSRSKLVLPDGSKVWLNAGSKLTYSKNFGTRDREVSLTGEAYFDVTRSADLPFIITTPTMQVKVLGTAFNVKSYPNEKMSETSVIRGSVEVIPNGRPDQKYLLRPNEKLVVANKTENTSPNTTDRNPIIALRQLTYFPADSSVIETSWVENRLVFDNESFAEVAVKMERWYGMKIEFRNNDLKNMYLTGIFVNETIHEALNALQLSSDFNYQVVQNTVIISK